jgi:hypothetical protein
MSKRIYREGREGRKGELELDGSNCVACGENCYMADEESGCPATECLRGQKKKLVNAGASIADHREDYSERG